jgi:hypothetical protein
MKLEITPAQVIKMKSRLKGMGLLGKKDELVIGVYIGAIEDNDPNSVSKEALIEIAHLIVFTNSHFDSESSAKYKVEGSDALVFKYRNNKRISLD